MGLAIIFLAIVAINGSLMTFGNIRLFKLAPTIECRITPSIISGKCCKNSNTKTPPKP